MNESYPRLFSTSQQSTELFALSGDSQQVLPVMGREVYPKDPVSSHGCGPPVLARCARVTFYLLDKFDGSVRSKRTPEWAVNLTNNQGIVGTNLGVRSVEVSMEMPYS